MSGTLSAFNGKIRELISVLMESRLYFELPLKDRLVLIRSLIEKMARPK